MEENKDPATDQGSAAAEASSDSSHVTLGLEKAALYRTEFNRCKRIYGFSLILSYLVIMVMLLKTAPDLYYLFCSMGTNWLPLPSWIVYSISRLFVNYEVSLVCFLIILLLLIWLTARSERFHDMVVLVAPYLGRLCRYLEAYAYLNRVIADSGDKAADREQLIKATGTIRNQRLRNRVKAILSSADNPPPFSNLLLRAGLIDKLDFRFLQVMERYDQSPRFADTACDFLEGKLENCTRNMKREILTVVIVIYAVLFLFYAFSIHLTLHYSFCSVWFF